jgi:plastocyanin
MRRDRHLDAHAGWPLNRGAMDTAQVITGLRRTSVLVVAAITAPLALGSCRPSDITAAPRDTAFVEMRDNFFVPQTVTIARGKSVRWTNRGQEVHTVATDTPGLGSDLITPTTWFEARFDDPGTFEYRCSLHPEMTGTVVVQ